MTPAPTPQPGVYSATVVRVTDGDSLDVDVQLLPTSVAHLTYGADLRLARCNARESKEPGGPEAKANLRELLPAGTVVTVQMLRSDEYGRVLAEVWLREGANLTDHLVADQWAAPWTGRGVKPVPAWPRLEQP